MKRIITLIMVLAAIATGTRLMAQEAYAVYTSSDNTLTFYYDSDKNGKDGVVYDLNMDGFTPEWINDKRHIVKVKFHTSFAAARPITTYYWFSGLEELSTIEGIWNLDTSEVNQMTGMFRNCKSLTSLDLSGFDTRKVFNMGNMFYKCEGLKSLDLSGFDTSNVTFMAGMFNGCENLTRLNVKSFDTSKLKYMAYMFCNCKGLSNLDVSNFNTENVVDMKYVFYGCQMQSLDLSRWNTSNVESVYMMFAFTELETLDLSSFDTSKVSDFGSMFRMSKNLSTIYAGREWVVNDNPEENTMLFYGCISLVGGEGTAYTDVYDINVWNDSHYAHVDGGEDYPGFFTAKDYGLRVSGTEVTSMNYDNIIGNSSAIYEPRTHTLTLNGGTFGKARQTGVFVSEDFDEGYSLNIELNGQNKLNSYPYYGITSYRSLWIEGNGSLEGDGINMVNGHLWVNDCKLNVSSIHANPEKSQDFWMNGSRASVSLNNNIFGFASFNLDEDAGLQIIEPQWAYYDLYDRCVKDGDGNEARGVVIGCPGGGTTGVSEASPLNENQQKGQGQDLWYTIDGRRLNSAPTQRGVYVRDGRKLVQ